MRHYFLSIAVLFFNLAVPLAQAADPYVNLKGK